MSTLKEASLTAQNTWSDAFKANPRFDTGVSISGTFVATVTVQRSFDGGKTWQALTTTYTGVAEFNIIPNESAVYRVGIATGDFTSGTVVIKTLG